MSEYQSSFSMNAASKKRIYYVTTYINKYIQVHVFGVALQRLVAFFPPKRNYSDFVRASSSCALMVFEFHYVFRGVR